MADTTLNPEDLLKLDSVQEGFIDKNINVLYLGTHSTLIKKIKDTIPMNDLEKAFTTIYKRIHQDPFYFLSYFTQNEPTAKAKQVKLENMERQLKDIQQYMENK